MPANNESRREMTPEEIEAVRKNLLERKKSRWRQVMQNLEQGAGERLEKV